LKNKYKCIIFDLDNTLLSYDLSAYEAIRIFLERYNIKDSSLEEVFIDMCNKLWTDFGLNRLKDPFIQKNYHELSEDYAIRRFEVFSPHLKGSMAKTKGAKELSLEFDEIFASCHIFEEGALEVVEKLSKDHLIGIATNGLSRLQSKRAHPFSDYTDHLFVSQEIGHVKPLEDFYLHILKKTKMDVKDCLFIGDLYTTDIMGALNVKMDACWYRPRAGEKENFLEDNIDDYNKEVLQIRALRDLLEHV